MSASMSDYLKRGDVLSRFTYYQGDRIPEVDVDNFPTTITFRDAKRVIREVPAADARPVVRARWEPGNPVCPVCGQSKFKGLDADIWADWMPPFCPNCGAQMDEKEDDDNGNPKL